SITYTATTEIYTLSLHDALPISMTLGAEVKEGWTVKNFSTEADGVIVAAHDKNGASETFRAAFLIDASGRGNMTGNQEQLRVVRSEEHTSELQSPYDLVCRLLLE